MFKGLFKTKEEKPVVEFSSIQEYLDIFPYPVAAHKKMPEWYRKLKPTIEGEPLKSAGTIKRCIPVLDAVSQGYVIPLWSDLHVKVARKVRVLDGDGKEIAQIHDDGKTDELVGKIIDDAEGTPTVAKVTKDGELYVDMSMPFENIFESNAIEGHAWEQVGDLCDLKKFKLGQSLLKFVNPWTIKTPSGWSVSFKNPSSNFSNDIHILEGVVDTDKYTVPVNFPFVWTGFEEGEWIIPKGTPLVQVIPFKREETDLVIKVKDTKSESKVQQKLMTSHFDRYKTMFWHRRDKYITKDISRMPING
jgi:hypothetical protein